MKEFFLRLFLLALGASCALRYARRFDIESVDVAIDVALVISIVGWLIAAFRRGPKYG